MPDVTGSTAVVTGGASGAGLVRVTRAALPHLRRSAAPVIVNTCSIAATAGPPGRAREVASAIAHLTRPYASAVTGTALAVDGGMAGGVAGSSHHRSPFIQPEIRRFL